MKIRTRLFVAYLLVVGVGFYALVHSILNDFRLRYQATMEETMVDMAAVLASMVEHDMTEGAVRVDQLHVAFSSAAKRQFAAQIYEMTKTSVNVRVYVTDERGIVVFDSDGGRDEGKDYSRWNDVKRTLQGVYGARATRAVSDDPMSATLYVAAPIRAGEKIVGVLAVGKPATSLMLFLEMARRDVTIAGVVAALTVVAEASPPFACWFPALPNGTN